SSARETLRNIVILGGCLSLWISAERRGHAVDPSPARDARYAKYLQEPRTLVLCRQEGLGDC
ncbi:MAG: hypothetical protein M3069_17040, partial [Chloroflexota bacterium]|nr:hypothetical protein [Chloroflexota bacterium]